MRKNRLEMDNGQFNYRSYLYHVQNYDDGNEQTFVKRSHTFMISYAPLKLYIIYKANQNFCLQNTFRGIKEHFATHIQVNVVKIC